MNLDLNRPDFLRWVGSVDISQKTFRLFWIKQEKPFSFEHNPKAGASVFLGCVKAHLNCYRPNS